MTLLILIGGVLHFGILIASGLVPGVLNWRSELARLSPLSRQLVWVHGAFIVLVIGGFGALSLTLPAELVTGSALARAVCSFIAIFWAVRLAIQFVVFDAKPYLTSRLLWLGYNALTAVFAYQVVVYSIAAAR
jgi:hypothetical protein